VVNHTINATPPERLQHWQDKCKKRPPLGDILVFSMLLVFSRLLLFCIFQGVFVFI